ncbi:disease resistance protein RPV1-like [Musa acuminata AAA Group]|uniref:disease resistance protein RPV1-like n=1 Tax=Musa acuminata AAA Group TaxID=214697 RepID=UPI0031CFBB14
MFPCGGSSVEVVSRLLKRLEETKGLLVPDPKGASSQVVVTKIDDIKKKMEELRKELRESKGKEDAAINKFALVARQVDELLRSAKKTLDPSETESRLKSKLDEIMKNINFKIEELKAKPMDSSGEQESKAEEKEEEEDFPLERQIQESSAWAHLLLVVDSFETQLKLCLFCLTIFPANAVLKKRLLIHWWMGEGIVKSSEEGKKCFDQLVSKGLIITIKKKNCDKVHHFSIQSWIRRLLITVAKSNAFLEFDQDGRPSNDYSRSRRACLRLEQNPIGDDGERRLLTVYNVYKRCVEFEPTWLVNKGEMTTMQLGRWKDSDQKHHIEVKNDEFLKGIEHCKSLRYMSLRGVSRVETLPESIGKLTKLMVLDLRACHNLEKLPEEIGSAKKLQYLDVSDCFLLDKMPKSIANLSDLEVLKGFLLISEPDDKHVCHLHELAKLAKLRKLSINIGSRIAETELEKVGELKTLTTLIITWAVVTTKKEDSHSTRGAEAPSQEKKQQGTGKDSVEDLPPKSKQSSDAATAAADADAHDDGEDDVIEKRQLPHPPEQKPSTSDVPYKNADPRIKDVTFGTDATTKKVQPISDHEARPTTDRQASGVKLLTKKETMKTVADGSLDPAKVTLPATIEKLDLRCFTEEEFPQWIGPSKLQKLKKLYLRGGMLRSLGDGRGWKVEVLRLRFLNYLDHPSWEKLTTSFPGLRVVEKFNCGEKSSSRKELSSWPCNGNGLWSKEDAEKSAEDEPKAINSPPPETD